MQARTNRSHDQNSQITGKILGIPNVLTMGSALQRLIGEQHQKLASKFPEHKNWELNTHKKAIEDRNWKIGLGQPR
jgi:hypothetical protein